MSVGVCARVSVNNLCALHSKR